MSSFIQIRPVGAELFHAETEIDGQTDMTKLIVVFLDFAKAPKTMLLCCLCITEVIQPLFDFVSPEQSTKRFTFTLRGHNAISHSAFTKATVSSPPPSPNTPLGPKRQIKELQYSSYAPDLSRCQFFISIQMKPPYNDVTWNHFKADHTDSSFGR
jgi:hypothetical protein